MECPASHKDTGKPGGLCSVQFEGVDSLKGSLVYDTVHLDNLEWALEKAENNKTVSLESGKVDPTAEGWAAFKSCGVDGTTSGLVAG